MARRWVAWGIVAVVLAAMAAVALMDRKVRIGRSVPGVTPAVGAAASDSTDAGPTSDNGEEAR